jgi:hypothetical protein
MFQLVTNGALDAVSIPIHKIAVAFKKSVSISTALYTPFAGRVYNSTWDGRRSISNCVNNLLDVYEFACRAQNWGEVGATEAPGKAYGSGALINTASFDSSELTYAREHRVALQLPDSLCMTEALKRKLCQVGFMGGYIDGNGKECVSTLFPQTFDVNDLVTFADIPDDLQPGEIIEPDASNVYCEPFVRYAYDKASETYTKLAQITNIHEDAWQASFTPGLSAAIGKRIWNKCKANYTAFQHIEEPPTDWTDQPLIIDSDDAEDFLERWVDLMTKKRIPVPVRYSKAKRWHVTRPVYLNLPHQTSGETYECIIEEITKKKNKGYCEIKFILLEKQVVVGANIQDVMYAKIQGADADWQDTMTEYGDDNDKADQMEVV